jgi:hypothetical protein
MAGGRLTCASGSERATAVLLRAGDTTTRTHRVIMIGGELHVHGENASCLGVAKGTGAVQLIAIAQY